ncbi:4-hydroxy-2-oxovalerate aldolase [Bradymonadaceae bacterium TMQ3]|uniref:4-hydroxy-2-oxovalerate aldolase n=1 Tax=Lujinxingia sediminis TaxID=2480984 RepID=A0ABY0CRB2_9DELT|nr:4-hydroxy-2-oxovalerate aldolase [Lujinxingia sediminis]RDV37707.1 4-hydroxy-2-oxovalerate aldolase [Bradymonadaceae bacterium TMQ3]RVU43114.1 4-hydroxy-2-oxovalerate aldolase [Lujinxingia sediminis]TXC75510.1 4-hydroxy-2-oxovalerate aldolase [Bradymonadales bacterium TMQ1]
MTTSTSSKKILVNDCTLRDGMHALGHQYSVAQMVAIARKLDEARVDIVEVSHGDGLQGNSFNYGFSAHSEREYIEAVRAELKHARLAALLLPGIGTRADIDEAKAMGVDTIRVATHCTEADVARQHIEHGRRLGLDTVGFLMMAHMTPTAELVRQARLMESYGAHCVYVTDSAGALLMEESREKVGALRDALDCQVGFHNHNNLGLGVANTIVAIEAGADRVDGSVAGMGAGAGNCPLEVLIAVCERMGIETGLELYPLIDCADQVVRPLQRRPVQTDGNALMLGYAGVYSSFLLHTERAAERFGVDPRDILVELGRRGMVGGQEDMILDVAMALKSGPST